MPYPHGVTDASYADEKAFISSNISPIEGFYLIKYQLNEMTWNIKVNEQKSKKTKSRNVFVTENKFSKNGSI